MLNEAERKQYSRQLILSGFGEEKQQQLKKAKVLVVGAGGLGCPALLYLAGAGVGTVGIIDGDKVDVSNLHRQVLYTHKDIGENKAAAAARRLSANNPHIIFQTYQEPLTSQNALDIMKEYDVIVDGTDNFQTRYLINDACVMLDKPFVYGAIMKFEGQVCVFNYQDGPTYRCLFPEPPAPGTVPGCAEVGVIGVLPGLIGTYQAIEVLKIVTGMGTVRSGQLLILNTLDNSQYSLQITRNPENMEIAEFSDYDAFCGVPATVAEITPEELRSKLTQEDLVLLDVREPHEVSVFNIGGLFIPLKKLDSEWETLPQDKELVVVCQSGKRSATAAQFLLDRGLRRVKSLKGGLNAW